MRAGLMITVNRRKMEYEKEVSVESLLTLCNYTYPLIVVKINGKAIPQEEFATAIVRDGDAVEAIHLIAGG